MPRDPYQLLIRPDKTTITCPGGIALGFGPGPGLRNAIFWNRIGSLFSSYRPAVAVLSVFDARRPNQPVALQRRATRWEPNLVTEHYSAPGLRLEERRTALKAGLRCLLKLRSTAKAPREWVLFFHGQVEQWEFFDYGRGLDEPQVHCRAVPRLRRIEITQPHPHYGLSDVSSLQTVTFSHELAACGFGQNTGDLHALWHDHGCLSNMRMRLGQLGGRLDPQSEPDFSHRHPLYYAALRITLEPGEMQLISIATQYHTDDEGGKLAGAYDGTAQDEWEQYLREEVPQLSCSDKALERYWYYVWYVLLANRTARGGHVTHQFTAPSKYMYWGPWIWDTYFHVLGEMWRSDHACARDSIRAVLDMQFPNGYLPVCSGSQYRMCFHDEAEGYTCPGGGGFASYVPSRLKGYKEAAHPYEAAIAYARRGRSQNGPDAETDTNGRPYRTLTEDHVAVALDRQMPEVEPGGYAVIPLDELIRRHVVTRRDLPPDISSQPLYVDVSSFSFDDSTQLGYLVKLIKLVNTADGRMVLFGANQQTIQLFRTIKLHKQVEIYSTLEEALDRHSSEAGQSKSELPECVESGGADDWPDDSWEIRRFTHNEKTQTPLITVAAAEYCQLHQDREFANEVLPALLKYDDWLWRRRTDKQGRFILWHGDESGWDNATRHYPVPAKPFDVQVHCLLHREALLSLMESARGGKGRRHRRMKEIEERAALTRKALSNYWDSNDRWHYDFGAVAGGQRTGKRRKQIAASSLFAMLVLDSPKVAEACVFALQHDKVFGSEYPIPTLARCDPEYSPHGWGWNGPAWLQVNYFTIEGLLRCGQYEAAFQLWEQTKKLIIRDGQPHSYELYDPETGTGMGCPDYSWQAMINHLIIARFAGVRPPLIAPALPPGLDRLALSRLPGPVSAIALRRSGMRVRIEVEFSAQVHQECERLRPGFGNFPLLVADGLGDAAEVSGNGLPFIRGKQWWQPAPAAEPSRSWEIIVRCR